MPGTMQRLDGGVVKVDERYVCPISGGKMRKWLEVPGDFRRKDDESVYELFWCEESGLGQLLPRPNEEEITSFYQLDAYYTHQDYDPYKRGLSFDEKVCAHIAWRFDRSKELNATRFRELKGAGIKSCCDVGCGGGGSLIRMRDGGIEELVGIDPDPDARESVKENGFEVYSGTAEELPAEIEGRRFDMVLMTHVLEHTVDPVAALKSLQSLVSDDGLLVIEVPNHDNYGLKMWREAWPWLDVPRHLNFFTKKSLVELCGITGWEIVSVEYRGYCRQFQQNWLGYEEEIIEHQERFGKRKSGTFGLKVRRWWRLLRTMFNDDKRKYDSVRIIAKLK
ncbi:class I SAM-dependent methyltransferase [Planctomycetota bacterium]|nr:class I SAM-dependent methyltransferase [Planctomycetota bacterium]